LWRGGGRRGLLTCSLVVGGAEEGAARQAWAGTRQQPRHASDGALLLPAVALLVRRTRTCSRTMANWHSECHHRRGQWVSVYIRVTGGFVWA
jgi:hypothetical protein